MFRMSVKNTPIVGSVLEKYGLEYLPEAHTYLMVDGEIRDLTFPQESELHYLKDVLYEEEILADQIPEYKEGVHKSYMKKWGVESGLKYTFEELCRIREECIRELSE